MFSVLGDIKIMSQSHSLHPLTNYSAAVNTNIPQSTNQGAGAAGSTNQRSGCHMQSLPDLTEMTRRPVNMMTMSRQPEIQRMSPIQILFNDSGQYFVNFNMNNQNQNK